MQIRTTGDTAARPPGWLLGKVTQVTSVTEDGDTTLETGWRRRRWSSRRAHSSAVPETKRRRTGGAGSPTAGHTHKRTERGCSTEKGEPRFTAARRRKQERRRLADEGSTECGARVTGTTQPHEGRKLHTCYSTEAEPRGHCAK